MAYKIRDKRGTAAQWSSANPVLGLGERGIVIDSRPYRFKTGDGSTHWNNLPFDTLPNATTSAAGLMSADDKSKVNDIPDDFKYSDLSAASAIGMPLVTLYMDVSTAAEYTVINSDDNVAAMAINGVFVKVATEQSLPDGKSTIDIFFGGVRAEQRWAIPAGAFADVVNIGQVQINGNCRSVGDSAFANTGADILLMPNMVVSVGSDAFTGAGDIYASAQLIDSYAGEGITVRDILAIN